MLVLYVLNRDFTVEGIIDDYVSLIWRPAYNDIGDFELYLGCDSKAVDLLQPNRYIVRDRDIHVDSNGVITYNNVMIIKNLTISTDVESGDYLTVTGRELKYLLHSRIVWNMTTINGNAESGIRKLINENAITPTESRRIIPTLTLDPVKGYTDTLELQVTGDYLDETITTICQQFNYGYDMYISDNQLRFRLYKGVNRSYSQTVRPYVIFSDNFDNLYNTEYQLELEEYANCTRIGGEGEGKDRKYTTANSLIYSGLDRFEVFTDARDISSNTDDGTLTPAQYTNLLYQRGLEKLQEVALTEGFSGEVVSGVGFKYGVDFYLGDTVTVINKYGVSKDVMVLSAIESLDENGEKLIPEFNI